MVNLIEVPRITFVGSSNWDVLGALLSLISLKMANLSTYFSTIGTINTLHFSRNTLKGTINHLLLLRY